MNTIDFGSRYIKIFDNSGKQVIKELSIQAEEDGEVIAYGNNAEKFLDSKGNVDICHLIKDGRITNLDKLQKFTKVLIEKNLLRRQISNPEFQILVPQNLRETEKEDFIKIFDHIDHKKIILTPSIIFYAKRKGLTTETKNPDLVLDYGAEVIQIAIIKSGRVEEYAVLKPEDREGSIKNIIKTIKKLVKDKKEKILAVILIGGEITEEERKKVSHELKMPVI